MACARAVIRVLREPASKERKREGREGAGRDSRASDRAMSHRGSPHVAKSMSLLTRRAGDRCQQDAPHDSLAIGARLLILT